MGHDTSSSLDTERERVNVHKDDSASGLVTGEDTTLNSSAVSNSLVRVDILASLLSEVLFKHSLDLGDTGGTADQDNVINVALLELGVLENLLHGLESLLEEIGVELFKLGTGEGFGEVLALVEGFNFDLGGLLGRKRTLGLLNLALQLTHGLRILSDVDTLVLVVFLDEVVDNAVVEIFTTEMGVTGGRLNFENTLLNSQDRNIEGTTTKVIDKDLTLLLVILLIKTIGKRGGGGFVDNAEDVQASDGSSVLSSGTLGVIEVGGNGNNGVLDGFTLVLVSTRSKGVR